MEFEELKRIIMNSIDEAKTPVDLFQLVINKVYKKGKEDKKKMDNKYICFFAGLLMGIVFTVIFF